MFPIKEESGVQWQKALAIHGHAVIDAKTKEALNMKWSDWEYFSSACVK